MPWRVSAPCFDEQPVFGPFDVKISNASLHMPLPSTRRLSAPILAEIRQIVVAHVQPPRLQGVEHTPTMRMIHTRPQKSRPLISWCYPLQRSES